MKKKLPFILVMIFLLVFDISLFIAGSAVASSRIFSEKSLSDIDKNDYFTEKYYITFSNPYIWDNEDKTMKGSQYDGMFYNNSNVDITDWKIVITFPERSVFGGGWNGEYEFKDNKVSLTSVEYNEVIKKGESIPFGFTADTPEEFHVSEVHMEVYMEQTLTDLPIYWAAVSIALFICLTGIIYGLSQIRLIGYRHKQHEYRNIIFQSLKTFSKIIDAKDPYTNGHSMRTAVYSREIARRMGFEADEMDRIFFTALLHDIGKIAIPDAILNKPGKLTEEEMNIIRQHTTKGWEMLSDFTAVHGIAEGAHYHHERYDGKGYPDHISGANIPLFVRIITVADSFDAMSSARCYRKEFSIDYILKELKELSGQQFDASIVPYMIQMINEGFAPTRDVEKAMKNFFK